MGEQDRVSIADAPNDVVAATFLVKLGASDLVRTKTLRAFTGNRFENTVSDLPKTDRQTE